MNLENLADKVKDMRALQIRYKRAKRIGQVALVRELEKEVLKAETEVDEILLKHFYTPEKKQSNLF